ncbi:transcription elongation factor S-II-like isoform X2 [Daphnia pulex]|uniref:transcription elongation factor S-II-like isoform X2 n=1 Tax=Daphnia pulex TaxID=6669 RepID=UPI001EE0CA41|nr:transcription elongation factor S-II-like isoform X2 [Daphnia pulex]XP_046445121.1 transcription elongation factor S-II-like isoform X2 [Daphnia pulex]
MDCEKDVLRIQKKLDKIVKEELGQDEALDYLKALKDLPINLAVLTSTRIGMTVNAIRKKSENDEVNNLTKALIKKWKKLLPGSANPKEGTKEEGKVSEKTKEPPKETPSKESSKDKKGSSSSVQSSFPALPSTTTDSVRLKCREMLCAAIKGDGVAVDGGGDPEYLAQMLEECIYKECRNTDMKYKNRVRSRVSNLKDARNPNLRLNFLCGQVSPARLSNMTSEEMASDEMKNIRQKFTKESINDAQLATVQGTQTDLLKCGKCGKRNCTYNQVQTRSADEPMTTFVLCNACGNRWKFC